MTDERMTDEMRTAYERIGAARRAELKARALRGYQECDLVESGVREAELEVLVRIPALLAHADALAVENAALRDVMSRAWDGYAAHGWFEHDQHDYQHEHPYCAECRAPVTFHYHGPNQYGGKSYLGYTCEHEAGCLVGQVEALLGGMQYVAPTRDAGALPPLVDAQEHG